MGCIDSGGVSAPYRPERKSDWLAVRAKLIMGEKGLPGFEVIDQKAAQDEKTAYEWIDSWKLETVDR